MALYHKWDVKNEFAYVFQFFSLISDGLDSVDILVEISLAIVISLTRKLAKKGTFFDLQIHNIKTS